MKKVFLMLGVTAFVLASCCGNKQGEACEQKAECEKKCEMTEEQKQACKEFEAKWADFDNQTPEVQEELIAKKRACTEAKIAKKKECAAKCEDAEKKAACEAKIAACEAKFAEFEKLSIADQKALLDSCCVNKKCSKSKTECLKEKADKVEDKIEAEVKEVLK